MSLQNRDQRAAVLITNRPDRRRALLLRFFIHETSNRAAEMPAAKRGKIPSDDPEPQTKATTTKASITHDLMSDL